MFLEEFGSTQLPQIASSRIIYVWMEVKNRLSDSQCTRRAKAPNIHRLNASVAVQALPSSDEIVGSPRPARRWFSASGIAWCGPFRLNDIITRANALVLFRA